MESESPVYRELNKSWKGTCRILLGEEIGELKEYDAWFGETLPDIGVRKSHLSGKDITIHPNHYCNDARFVSFDEVKPQAIDVLSINDIKDVDSIVEAVSKKWEYVGDKALGISKFVESSDSVKDSMYVMNSTNVQNSSYIYSAFFVNDASKYVFGGNWVSKTEFVVKCGTIDISRAFESFWVSNGSDLYYSYGCAGCHDLLFCFNLRNKRNCIGNIELPREKYLGLKAKLIGEIREELKKDKKFPSLFKMVKDMKPDYPKLSVPKENEKDDLNFGIVDKAFSSTSKIIFKKDLGSIVGYEKWLSRHLIKLTELKSHYGSETYKLDMNNEIEIYPKDRIVSHIEALELGKLHLNNDEIESVEKIKKAVSKIAFFFGDIKEGRVQNAIKSPVAWESSNLYKVSDTSHCEYCGVCGVIHTSKYVFGSIRTINSNFCIHCCNSLALNRCYGLDACKNSSDSFFCHNCENLQDAMFCFNTKSKRYAIGNAQLQPEQYRKIKDMLVEQMADELIKRKELKWDIFNIGCGKA